MKTAVEFIEESINDLSMSISDGYKLIKILKQAKAMEKEQIIEANENKMPFITGEEYYQETFKSQ